MRPAEQMAGVTLDDGWTILEKAKRKPNATGGHFSVGYVAEHRDGRRGFLKALDYTKAFESEDTHQVLAAMTQAYLFEKTLCEKCAHLSKVARALGSGFVHLNPENPFQKVEYLIFELADEDIRSHLDTQETLDLVFLLKTLHQVATGLAQLHRAEMAHQDLKPSNVLIYSGGHESKICDLGRGWDRNTSAPHDSFPVAGDRTYAPIEAQYGVVAPDHRARRFGCDMYHLGSLVPFLFMRTNINALLMDNMAIEHRPFSWGGSYPDVLPYVQAAFELVLDQLAEEVPQCVRTELCDVVMQLCNPDPNRRGHPQNRGANQFSLERYISLFNRMAYVARISLYREGMAASA